MSLHIDNLREQAMSLIDAGSERNGDLDEAAGAADATACSWGGSFARIKISSAWATTDDNIRTVLNTWVQGKLAFWWRFRR